MIIGTARDAAELLAPLFAEAGRELLAVLYLDEGRRLIGRDDRPLGSARAIDLPVREIVATALRIGSAGLIVAHNHPSGDAEPSRADLEATRRLADTLANLRMQLHDHLIFAGGGCRSFRELGLL